MLPSWSVGMEDTLTIDNYNESCHGNSGACKQVGVGGFDSIEIGESSCLSSCTQKDCDNEVILICQDTCGAYM